VRILLIVIVVLLFVAAVVVVLGLRAPRDHVASRSVLLAAPPETIWRRLVEVEKGPEWRTGLKSVEVLPPEGGKRRYREVSGFGTVTYVVEEESPPRRLVGRIADEGLGYGGTWTFDLAREGSRTRVTITERGFVTNVFFRFLAHHIFGYEKTLDTYLKDLAHRLGEPGVVPGPGRAS
jgi:uncharacterized protein YndB with AHSA1/START domain